MRLVFRGITVEGPPTYCLLSDEFEFIWQPLPTDPVPEGVVRAIAHTFNLPVEGLYVDQYDEGK